MNVYEIDYDIEIEKMLVKNNYKEEMLKNIKRMNSNQKIDMIGIKISDINKWEHNIFKEEDFEFLGKEIFRNIYRDR